MADRSAFGGLLADKPLMQNVIADLAVEAEAATALAIRLAAAVDAVDDPHEAALRRIALPLAKFWVCKRTPMMRRGGAGVPRRQRLRRGVRACRCCFRESPLNSIWEGSGNVNALDVLRALGREPEVLDAWLTEVGLARGEDPVSTGPIDDVLGLLGDTASLEVSARRLAGQMAACLQAALLVRFAPAGGRRRASAAPGSARRTTAPTARSCRRPPTCARSWSARRRSSSC